MDVEYPTTLQMIPRILNDICMSFTASISMVLQLIISNLFHFVSFCNIFTFLSSIILNEFIDFDKIQEVVDCGRSFCFT